MKLNYEEFQRGYNEVIKTANEQPPAAPSTLGSMATNVWDGVNNLFHNNVTQPIETNIENRVGQYGGKLLGQLAPLAMLPMLAGGFGGGNAAAAGAPGQPVVPKPIGPISPAGFKYGHDKQAVFVGPAIKALKGKAIDHFMRSDDQDKKEKQPDQYSSKDKDIQKVLGNSDVKDYIEGLTGSKG